MHHPVVFVLAIVSVVGVLTVVLQFILPTSSNRTPTQLADEATDVCGGKVRDIRDADYGIYAICLDGRAIYIER